MEPSEARSPVGRAGVRWALFAAGILILGVALWKTDLLGFREFPRILRPEYVAASAAAVAGGVVVAALKTRALLRAVAFPAQLRLLVEVEMIYRFLIHLLPLKLGVLGKAAVLAKRSSLTVDRSIGATLFDYLLDGAFPIVVTLLGLPLLFPQASPVSTRGVLLLAVVLTVLVAAFLLLPLRMLQGWLRKLERWPRVHGAAARLLRLTLTVREMWRSIVASRQMLPVGLLMAGAAALMATAVQFLFWSTGTQVPFLWVFVVAHAGVVVGGASMVPLGGLGVREATMHLLFVLGGIDPGASLYAVLLSRAFLLAPVVAGYFLSLRLGVRWMDRFIEKPEESAAAQRR